jgi:threonine dehydrogenase-like Zn-dependent dehydrogenase
MSEVAQAFWIASPGHGEIRDELVVPAPGDVVIRALYSGISRGTEALVFAGHVPESEYQRMRAPFQTGEFPGPVKYGYSSVGVVEQGPGDLINRHAFVLYPHQTRYAVPVESMYLLPEGVPPRRAVLTANLETAVNGLWDARPHIGDRITVVGGGTVGCLVAWLAGRLPGSTVELVDVNPQRAPVARSLGVRFVTPEHASQDADLVVHASGSPGGLDLALRIAGFEATIVELSWYGDRVVPVPLGQSFHVRRLILVSSQVGRLPASQRARWDPRRRMRFAMSLLADPTLDVLITGESAFHDLPRVMADLESRPGNTLCHCIRYS